LPLPVPTGRPPTTPARHSVSVRYGRRAEHAGEQCQRADAFEGEVRGGVPQYSADERSARGKRLQRSDGANAREKSGWHQKPRRHEPPKYVGAAFEGARGDGTHNRAEESYGVSVHGGGGVRGGD
jgi:hypothetical protein